MNRYFTLLLLSFSITAAHAESVEVTSPDGRLKVTVSDGSRNMTYKVTFEDRTMLEPSLLGLQTSIGDFANGMTIKSHAVKRIDSSYTLHTAKASSISYSANELELRCSNAADKPLTVRFRVSDNDIAFRYEMPTCGDTLSVSVSGEATSFRLPDKTTTFLSPHGTAMTGWMRTKPCYEEEYTPDAPMTDRSKYGHGYSLPCLFRVADDGWVLISETGTTGRYVGCHLSDYSSETGYSIAFPMPEESNGWGTADALMPLPASTPWRTITVGTTLKPIVETTIPYDVVEEQYKASTDYRHGRYTWSWLIWQDDATVYDDQLKFIDLAAEMGYEYCLVDALWDTQIGYGKIEQLSRYAQSKGVRLILWYNSNGTHNDAPQGPRHRMNTPEARRQEMAWMQKNGIAGIKVDFFNGDKQHMMQLYEDILSDANHYGIQVIFHGCTIPRGWERMYPNFVASEGVLASENIYFTDHHAQREPFELTMHPFCRNAIGAMDWGGTILNRYMSRDNKSRHQRITTNAFELAAAIVNQSAIQCIAIYPNNLPELTPAENDFLRSVPTVWDETRYIDGYPGRYAVIARRAGSKWYVAGLNATGKDLSLTLSLPMLKGESVTCTVDGSRQVEAVKRGVGRDGTLKMKMKPNGGFVISN